jgi:hypothetical protein
MTLDISESEVDELADMLLETVDTADSDAVTAIAAAIDVINQLAKRTSDPEATLDYAAARLN